MNAMIADVIGLLFFITATAAFGAALAFSRREDSVLRDSGLLARTLVFVAITGALCAGVIPAILAMAALGL